MAQNTKPITGYCVYCNKAVDTSKPGNFYSKTKRKTTVLFHGSCYKTYHVVCGADWIE